MNQDNSQKKENSNNVGKVSNLLHVEDEKIKLEGVKKKEGVEKSTKIIEKLDYNSISDLISKIFEKLNKKMDKWMILKVSVKIRNFVYLNN